MTEPIQEQPPADDTAKLAAAIAVRLNTQRWNADPAHPALAERSAHDRHQFSSDCAVCAKRLDQIAAVAAEVAAQHYGRQLRQLVTMDRFSTRHALKVEQEIAEVEARLAHRDAEIARFNAAEAGRRLEMHDLQAKLDDAVAERDRLAEQLRQVRDAAHYRDLGMNAERRQWQAEFRALWDLLSKYGDDGAVPVTAVRALFRGGPGQVPQPGDRVEDGGVMGTLVRCTTCSGDGLLHQPDEQPAGPDPEPMPSPWPALPPVTGPNPEGTPT